MMGRLANSIKAPYFQVTVTASSVIGKPLNDFTATDEMISLAPQMMGFLGLETDQDQGGRPQTCFYWRDRSSLDMWASFSRQHLAEQGEDKKPCALPRMTVKWVAPPKPVNALIQKILPHFKSANSQQDDHHG